MSDKGLYGPTLSGESDPLERCVTRVVRMYDSWLHPGSQVYYSGMINLEPYLADFPWLSGLPELDASTFTWETNERDNGWLLADEFGRYPLPSGWIPLGYCDASKLRVRPRENQLAIMFASGSEEFWQHIQPM